MLPLRLECKIDFLLDISLQGGIRIPTDPQHGMTDNTIVLLYEGEKVFVKQPVA
jgi:hypothetical protein